MATSDVPCSYIHVAEGWGGGDGGMVLVQWPEDKVGGVGLWNIHASAAFLVQIHVIFYIYYLVHHV
jgi:hypothetical protein